MQYKYHAINKEIHNKHITCTLKPKSQTKHRILHAHTHTYRLAVGYYIGDLEATTTKAEGIYSPFSVLKNYMYLILYNILSSFQEQILIKILYTSVGIRAPRYRVK